MKGYYKVTRERKTRLKTTQYDMRLTNVQIHSNLIIADVINTRQKVNISYLFIQSDNVVVKTATSGECHRNKSVSEANFPVKVYVVQGMRLASKYETMKRILDGYSTTRP
jgi:hypothetical protein